MGQKGGQGLQVAQSQERLPADERFPAPERLDVSCLRKSLRLSNIYSLNGSSYLGNPYADKDFVGEISGILKPVLQAFEYDFVGSAAAKLTVAFSPVPRAVSSGAAAPLQQVAFNNSDGDTEDSQVAKQLHRIECGVQYSRRQFCVAPAQPQIPPMLLSFPGAGMCHYLFAAHGMISVGLGNTWMRFLIEFYTGYFTGEVDSLRDA
jgi:hypothetical protein